MKTKLKLFKAIKLISSGLILAMIICSVAFAAPHREILNIELKTSKYMQMNQKITRLAVGDPQIATVVPLSNSNSEFLIVTKSQGSTSLFVWTADGVRYEYLIAVSPEDVGLAEVIQQAIGLPDVRVRIIDNRILLTGNVRNQYERNLAVQTARFFTGRGSESSLSIGSGFDLSLNTQNASAGGNVVLNNSTIGDSQIQSKGEVIDLLHLVNPTQIKLEAQVIAIRPTDVKQLGVQYGNDPLNAPGIFNITDTQGSGSLFRHDVWSRNPIDLTLGLLISKNRAKVLSRPNITTMSGEEAVIQVGGEIPYLAVEPTSGRADTRFKNYGIILQFKPIADIDNRITLTVHAEVSNMSGETVDGQPILEVRRADSVITVGSGSTMVIGGLMDSNERKVVTKFPFLGDIPIIGEFFKYTSKTKDKQELIILVRPYIVEEDEISQAQMSDSMQNLYNTGQQEKNNLNTVDLDEMDVPHNHLKD